MVIEYTGRPLWYLKEITELIEYTAALLTKHEITFWLDAGNLLGAARNGKMISWDYDGDMSVFEKDIEQIEALEGEIKEEGYNLAAIRHSNRVHVIKIYRDSPDMHLDLWPCFITKDNVVQNIHIGHFHVPLIDITNLKLIEYDGQMYPCPDNVEVLIESRYGKDWRTYLECMQYSINMIKKYDPSNTEILSFIYKHTTIKE